jgi:putative ABC transport system permease protein
MVLLRLALSNFKVRKVRMLLTLAAIAQSVSLVVAVTSGYKSMEGMALRFLNQYMGAADVVITPGNEFSLVPEKLVKELAADPDVRQVVGRLESDRPMNRKQGSLGPTRSAQRLAEGALPETKIMAQMIGVRRPDDNSVVSMDLTDGVWFKSSDGNEAVVDQVAAGTIGARIGDEIDIPGINKLTLKIVGIVHKPVFFAQHAPTIYVPMNTLQHFADEDNPPMVSTISINLKDKANFAAFQERWTERLKQIDPSLQLRARRQASGELEKNLRGVQIASYLSGTISMLTATFIIFSAMSMGVSERQRTLAMLRAIGAVRMQVFQLVIMEAAALAALGIAVGIPLGMFWLWLLHLRFPEIFLSRTSFNFSYPGMAFAAGGSLLTALMASALPAWWASRISPLEAMNPQSAPTNSRPPIYWGIAGALLACIDPFLFFGPVEGILKLAGFSDPAAAAESVKFAGHFVMGLPGIMIGFFLMAPMIIWGLERILAPVMAAVLALPAGLLRQQLSTGIWRAAGTGAALMVGLATLIAMQVQGHTLIGGWKLPDRFPDIFIWSPDIISWKDQETLASVQGIEPGTLLPVVVTTPAGDSKSNLLMASMMAGQNVGTMFFAVDPEKALRMVQLDFRDDNGVPLPPDQQTAAEAHAVQEMKKPRHIVVTDEFRQSRHLKVGDTFKLLTTLNGWQDYTICAVVWSPGADVLVSMYDLGHVLDQRTAGSVFGSIADAKSDFGVTGARLFAANLLGGVDKNDLLKNVQRSMGDRGLSAGDVRQIKSGIESGFYRILDLMSTVAVAAMALASLGVTNTIMASVRSRRWQFGILRSIGLVRGELVRLILAEAIMLGLVGAALGLGAGFEISVDARRLSGTVLGYAPPMQVPWRVVLEGCLALVAVALAASLWPAAGAARAEPLDLLQAGRASI